jgi:polyprenyl synthetase
MDKYLLELKNEFNEVIDMKLKKHSSQNEKLNEMLRYAVVLGGKRIRPIIMYILADIYGKEHRLIENEAVAIELIHSYSLVHDDMPCMDDDEYRRGNLTVHKKYGQANALLVGDALLTLAFQILAESEYSNKNSILALSYYSGYNGMIKGQYLDIISENMEVDYNNLMEIHLNKTAMLLMASVELACINLKIDLEIREKLRKYIMYVGLAYQIQDDILEVRGKFEKTGKKNTDIRNNKKTFVTVLGLESSELIKTYFINEAKALVEGNEKLIEFAEFLLNRES